MPATYHYRADQRSELDTVAFMDYGVRHVVEAADIVSNVVRLPVEANRTVVGVRLQILTAFNGTTPTVKVGDGTDDDGFLVTTDVDVTSVGAFANSVGKGHDVTGTWTPNALGSGKHYTTGGAVVLTFAGSPTVGKLACTIVYDGYAPAERGMITNYPTD